MIELLCISEVNGESDCMEAISTCIKIVRKSNAFYKDLIFDYPSRSLSQIVQPVAPILDLGSNVEIGGDVRAKGVSVYISRQRLRFHTGS